MNNLDWEKIWTNNQLVLEEFKNQKKFLLENIITKQNYELEVNFLNERTLAYLLSWSIQKQLLKKYSIENNHLFLINEFAIKLDEKITKYIEGNYKGKGKYPRLGKQHLTPDVFFTFIENNNIHTYFIEYKVNNEFEFIQFADDYIKFLYYTEKEKTLNSVFIYVLIYKIKEDASLISPTNNKPVINFLTKSHDPEELNKNANIFIISSEKNNLKFSNDIKEKTVSPYEIQLLDKAANLSNKMAKNEVKWIDNETYKDQFENEKFKFGQNVIEANAILNNYENINKIYSYLLEHNIKIKVPKDNFININLIKELQSYIDSSEINIDKNAKLIDLINRTTSYFENFLNKISSKKEVKSNDQNKVEVEIDQSEYQLIRRRTNWIIAIISLLTKINNIDIELDNTSKLEKMTDKILNNYHKEEHKINLNELYLGLIFFITNFYKKRTEKINGKFSWKKDYLLFKTKNTFIDTLSELNKLLNFSTTTFEDNNFDLKEEGINIVKKLLSKY